MCFNPVLGFLSVSTSKTKHRHPKQCFNPVLGFLSVSTIGIDALEKMAVLFQSRAGFSECLDRGVIIGL